MPFAENLIFKRVASGGRQRLPARSKPNEYSSGGEFLAPAAARTDRSIPALIDPRLKR